MEEINVTAANFEAEVLQSPIPVIVDFWAVWCGPCKVLSPIIAEIGEDHKGKVKVVKVNVDDEPELTQRFGILSIPTMKFFKNGEVVGEIIGAAPKTTIETEISKHI